MTMLASTVEPRYWSDAAYSEVYASSKEERSFQNSVVGDQQLHGRRREGMGMGRWATPVPAESPVSMGPRSRSEARRYPGGALPWEHDSRYEMSPQDDDEGLSDERMERFQNTYPDFSDEDGWIRGAELRRFFQALDLEVTAEEVSRVLREVDPTNLGRIHYSECMFLCTRVLEKHGRLAARHHGGLSDTPELTSSWLDEHKAARAQTPSEEGHLHFDEVRNYLEQSCLWGKEAIEAFLKDNEDTVRPGFVAIEKLMDTKPGTTRVGDGSSPQENTSKQQSQAAEAEAVAAAAAAAAKRREAALKRRRDMQALLEEAGKRVAALGDDLSGSPNGVPEEWFDWLEKELHRARNESSGKEVIYTC